MNKRYYYFFLTKNRINKYIYIYDIIIYVKSIIINNQAEKWIIEKNNDKNI